jgi:hypothetical protein
VPQKGDARENQNRNFFNRLCDHAIRYLKKIETTKLFCYIYCLKYTHILCWVSFPFTILWVFVFIWLFIIKFIFSWINPYNQNELLPSLGVCSLCVNFKNECLNETLKGVLYKQLFIIYRLRLYAIFINEKNDTRL